MAKTPPERSPYQKYGETEFGGYGLNLGRQGYQGIEDNYNKVNTMNQDTQADINSRLGNIYNRAKQDFGINYNNQMAKQLANQYGRMGTANATSSLYANDMANRQSQRALADLAYNQAQAYESNVDRELKRRYDVLDMYNKMFGEGKEVGKSDWTTGKENQDIAYQNDYNKWATGEANKQTAINAGMDALKLALALRSGGISSFGGFGSSGGDMTGGFGGNSGDMMNSLSTFA